MRTNQLLAVIATREHGTNWDTNCNCDAALTGPLTVSVLCDREHCTNWGRNCNRELGTLNWAIFFTKIVWNLGGSATSKYCKILVTDGPSKYCSIGTQYIQYF